MKHLPCDSIKSMGLPNVVRTTHKPYLRHVQTASVQGTNRELSFVTLRP